MKERKYVVRAVQIDGTTTLRKRVLLTPDRCKHCGFSVCEQNGLGDFDDLDPKEQARVRAALAAHRKVVHPADARPVLSESEMPKQWLGGNEPSSGWAHPAEEE